MASKPRLHPTRTKLESNARSVAIAVLNKGIRPFLSKWHPELQAWEVQRTFTVGAKDHERSWSKETQLRRELNALRDSLGRYAAELAKLAGVDHY